LARLLSIETDLRDVKLVDPLPAPEALALEADKLIALAKEMRLDLRAVRQAVKASGEKLRLEHLRVFPEIGVGPYLERMESNAEESGGIDAILGPSIDMTIPIFDQNQAQAARARFAHAQVVKSYEELQANITQDIRIAADRATVLQTQVAFYHEELIPQAARNVEFAEISYRAGNTDLVTLLQAQRTAIQIRQAHVVAWSESAAAWADVELAVGCPLNTYKPIRNDKTAATRPSSTNGGSQ